MNAGAVQTVDREWIENAIDKGDIKCFNRNDFTNFQLVGEGGFAKVYRVNWKRSNQYYALKFFHQFNDATLKEIVYEVTQV
jgi:hypothetical protein